jgi:GNAT superfamily N-acetyltransferase
VGAITVRAARPGDGPAIARIHLQAARYYVELAPSDFRVPDEEGLGEALDPRAEILGDTSTLFLVAEVEGEVGSVLIARLLPPHARPGVQIQPDLGKTRLEIGYLETDERFRRRGLATRLVSAAEEWGRSNGASVAVTDTYHASPLSVPFWTERMGYEPRSVNLRKMLEP